MMAGGFKVTGTTQVVADLGRLEADVEDLTTTYGRIGARVVVDARQIAPKRSGRLAASIAATQIKDRARLSAGSAGVPYAGVIHYGWAARNIAPQPFLIAAAQRNEDTTAEELDAELRRSIARHRLN
jgi:hypothetical protein